MINDRKTTGAHCWLVMWKAYKAIEVHEQKSIAALGFRSVSDFAVLEVLYHKGSLPVSAIGQKVFLTSGSITTAVDRAEKKKYIRRKPSKVDRRVIEVELTSKGKRVIESAFEAHQEKLESLFAPMTTKERIVFVELLKKVGIAAQELEVDLGS